MLPAGKFLLTDDNRLLVGGTWHEPNDRVYFTPVLGSLDQGDDERYVDTATQKNWVSLTTKNGGRITGMGGPVQNGLIYVFKYRQIWRLSPTGEVTAPYLVRKVSNTVGCIRHRTIIMGEDATGNAALYFLSHRGPFRISVDGIEYLGRDIEDRWYGRNGLPAVNLAASAALPTGSITRISIRSGGGLHRGVSDAQRANRARHQAGRAEGRVRRARRLGHPQRHRGHRGRAQLGPLRQYDWRPDVHRAEALRRPA